MMLAILIGGLERLSHLRNERGASGVEYGLLVALIAAVIVGIVASIGDEIAQGFQDVLDEL
jgi:pilus assembly protein Flp/PilA